DVWGDAVNIASRMESTGEPGKIQVSQDTYEHLNDEFLLERRGVIDVKGKGKMQTWFLIGHKEPASARRRTNFRQCRRRSRPKSDCRRAIVLGCAPHRRWSLPMSFTAEPEVCTKTNARSSLINCLRGFSGSGRGKRRLTKPSAAQT